MRRSTKASESRAGGSERLGSFSVERGGHNEVAKRFAIDVVKRGQEVLVIFPEGEIYYLNDLVQPFKSGAVEIGMQAVVEVTASAARLDRLSGPDGHQVSLPPAHSSCP